MGAMGTFDQAETVQAELGPVLPSRASVRMKAREIMVLAKRAEEFASDGPTTDLQMALRQLEHIRAVVGEGEQAG